jgi:RNA polymerase sigma-70 factor (ECF subfamily)
MDWNSMINNQGMESGLMALSSRRITREVEVAAIEERELVTLSQQGDKVAMSELFGRHYRASLRVAQRILSSTAESEDAVQAAYCSAFQHLDAFRGESSFRTWITRIVVNRCLMTIREPWRRMTITPEAYTKNFEKSRGLDDFPSQLLSPEKAAWCREIAVAHGDAIAALPKHLCEAYTLFALSGLTIADVARQLGLTIPATKSRLFRARNAMRISLRPLWVGGARCNSAAVARRAD